MNNRHPWQLKKNQNSEGHFGALPIQPIHRENGPNGLNWHCCSAGSSKTAPRILIFSIAIGADYSFEMKNCEIWATPFFKHNNLFIATVSFFGTRCCFIMLWHHWLSILYIVLFSTCQHECQDRTGMFCQKLTNLEFKSIPMSTSTHCGQFSWILLKNY